MITFKQFIREADHELADDLDPSHRYITFAEVLNGSCKPFMAQSQGNGLLFRGMDNSGDRVGKLDLFNSDGDRFTYYRKSVRKDRKPMSTKGPVHKVIDDWFEEEMGMRARSQAVFCYGEPGKLTAASYGQTHVIVPIGKFIYCWSPNVKDLYDVIVERIETSDGKVKKHLLGSDGKPDPELINDEMSSLGYTINGFDKALLSHSEIMIEVDEYFSIPCRTFVDVEILTDAFKDARK